MKNAYSTYRSANVDTADQGKLIIIAYDVAIKHCRLSLEKFGSYELIEQRTKHLFKAQDALNELMSALRMDVGQIAQNLYQLYDYMIRRLIHANSNDDKSAVEECLTYLVDLRDAWQVAIRNVKTQNASSDTAGNDSIAITG
ncbi:MAG: flagellar export chaperone FliS [Chitinivibrionales bacterium]